jgi:hypothetical protein
MAAHTTTEQMMDIWYTFQMMGVPLDGPSWMFGDNQSVITSSTKFSTTSTVLLSYHFVCNFIAAEII